MKVHKSFFIGLIITILLLIGAVVAYILSQKPQEIRQHASEKPFGQAIVFNGSTTVLKSPTNIYLKAPFTIEGWFNAQKNSPSDNVFGSHDTNDASCKGQVQVYINPSDTDPTTGTLMVANSGTSFIGGTTSTITYGKWTHIAYSRDTDGTAVLFINGHKVGTATGITDTCINSTFYVGGYPSTDKDIGTFKGQMDEVRVSNSIRYTDDFTPSQTPFTIDPQTSALFHLDGSLKDEYSGMSAIGEGTVTYVDSTLPESTTAPACQATTSVCSWDPVDTAVSYHYVITQQGKDTPIAEGDVQAPATSTTFVSEDNATYTCSVTATNACGTGPAGTATATCALPTATPTPIPSSTPTPAPTNTPTPVPSATPTPVPTSTPVPPTSTPVPPTATPVPPTAVVAIVTPTPTTPPGIPTNTPTPTLPSPGSPIETITIAGGALLTIVGAILLFAL